MNLHDFGKQTCLRKVPGRASDTTETQLLTDASLLQTVMDAPDMPADTLAAMLHAAAGLSAVTGLHSGASAVAAGAGSGFHAARGASLQAFERSLQWPQLWHNDGLAYCAVRCKALRGCFCS